MTTFAKSAKPEGTAIAWATQTDILVEIPCADGPPYIVRYKRTLKGLSEALNVMVKDAAKATYDIQDRPRAKADAPHSKVRRPVGNYSNDMRASARAALKRLKIT
jgi:hypothetical protein